MATILHPFRASIFKLKPSPVFSQAVYGAALVLHTLRRRVLHTPAVGNTQLAHAVLEHLDPKVS
jgi:hypothetical protein